MERVKHAGRNRIPEPVSLGVGGITNENTGARSGVYFRKRRGVKGEGAAINFAQM
jgi:predicted NUDIX family phosphoesterase